MISASTIASGSSSGFSAVGSASTPQSSYTPSSAKPTSGNASGNPLKDLIETEKEYLDTLKIITTQIAPIWSNDQRSTDFTELLKHAQDILKINKRFCTRLIKISASPQGIRELGDVLMQWVNEMEAPYANYSRSFISNLNDRQDIVGRPSVKAALYALSVQHSYEITMESLVNAPIQRMLYYKILYGRLLETTEPGRSDHQLLAQANQRIDTIMLMAKKNTRAMTSPLPSHIIASPPSRQKSLPNVPHINTTFSPSYSPMQKPPQPQGAILDLEKMIDASTAVDVFSREPKKCRLQLSSAPRTLIVDDDFTLFPATGNTIAPIAAHVFLLSDVLIVAKRLNRDELVKSRNDGSDYMYSLVFPPLALKHVQFGQLMPERESLGEYYIQVSIRNTDCMHLRTDSRAVKALWLEKTSPRQQNLPPVPAPNYPMPGAAKPPAPFPKNSTVPSPPSKEHSLPSNAASDSNRDTIFDMYTSTEKAPSRDTIFGMYSDEPEPHSTPELPPMPKSPAPSNSGAAVTHEFIKPAVSHTLESIHISSPVQSPSRANFMELPKLDRLKLDDNTFSNLSSSPPPATPTSLSHRRRSFEPESPLPTSPGVQLLSSGPPLSQSVSNGYIPPPTVHNMELAVSEVPEVPLLSQPIEVDRVVAPIAMQAAVHNAPAMLTASKSAPTSHLGPQQNLPPIPSPDPMFINSAPTMLNSAGGGPAGMSSPPMRPRPPPPNFAAGYRPPPGGHMGHPPPPFGSSPPPGAMYNSRPLPPPGMMARPPFPPNQRPPPFGMNSPVPSKSMGHRPPPLAMQPRPGMPPMPRPMMYPQDPSLRRSPTHGPQGGGAPGGPQQALPPLPSQEGYSFLNVPHNGSPLGSPRSPTTANAMAAVKEVTHRTPPCDVFRWKDNSWAAVEGQCIAEIRQTMANRPCLAIVIKESNHMYLNAWVNRNMTSRQEAPTDVSIGIDMGNGRKENYLVHCNDPRDAHALAGALHRTSIEVMNATRQEEQEQYHTPILRSTSLGAASIRKPEDGPQTTKPVMQCRCKIFLQNEHASWTNLGNAGLRLSMQIPSQRIHVYIESEKDSKRLVNTFIQSNFVERVSGNTKRITFRLMNETTRATAVYMVQVKDDKVGIKIYDYLKGNRAQN